MKISRYIYLGAAWLFVAGVLTQVFLAGMVVVASRMSWANHISLGHLLAAPLIIMLVTMYLGRMPVKRLTWLLFLVYALGADVFIFLRADAPVLSALHPVMALVDFGLGFALARRALSLAREARAPAAVRADLNPSASS